MTDNTPILDNECKKCNTDMYNIDNNCNITPNIDLLNESNICNINKIKYQIENKFETKGKPIYDQIIKDLDALKQHNSQKPFEIFDSDSLVNDLQTLQQIHNNYLNPKSEYHLYFQKNKHTKDVCTKNKLDTIKDEECINKGTSLPHDECIKNKNYLFKDNKCITLKECINDTTIDKKKINICRKRFCNNKNKLVEYLKDEPKFQCVEKCNKPNLEMNNSECVSPAKCKMDGKLAIDGKCVDYNYKKIDKHIGCHHYAQQPHNKGIIRGNPTQKNSFGEPKRPMHILTNVSEKCLVDPNTNSKCIDIGKAACQKHNEKLRIDDPNRCIGFGVHKGWGVQLYNLKALNIDLCKGTSGLMKNNEWQTYIEQNHLSEKYHVYKHQDSWGGDFDTTANSIYNKRREIDLPTCKYLCNQINECKIFTHYKNTCYLKNSFATQDGILKLRTLKDGYTFKKI